MKNKELIELLRKAYLSGIMEKELADKMQGFRHNLESMATSYAEIEVNNSVSDDVIVSQNYHCYNCQSKNIKTTKYKCRDCNYKGRKG